MAKLTLPESDYKEIPNVKKCEKMTSPEYDSLAEEATKIITMALKTAANLNTHHLDLRI